MRSGYAGRRGPTTAPARGGKRRSPSPRMAKARRRLANGNQACDTSLRATVHRDLASVCMSDFPTPGRNCSRRSPRPTWQPLSELPGGIPIGTLEVSPALIPASASRKTHNWPSSAWSERRCRPCCRFRRRRRSCSRPWSVAERSASRPWRPCCCAPGRACLPANCAARSSIRSAGARTLPRSCTWPIRTNR